MKDQQTYTKLNGDYDFNTASFDIYKTQLDTTNSILDQGLN